MPVRFSLSKPFNLLSMKKNNLLLISLLLITSFAQAQRVGSSPEYIKALTSEWKGERSADGRPHVSDAILAG